MLVPTDIIVDTWDDQLKWHQIIILKKRKDNGWGGYEESEAQKIKIEILIAQEVKRKAEELLQKYDDERGEECQKLKDTQRYCDCRYCSYGWILEEILGVKT
jgi:hypothetical protein